MGKFSSSVEQEVAALHRLTRPDVELRQHAGDLAADLVLHLHRLEHDHALADLDPPAFLDQDGHHAAGHVGGHRPLAVGREGEEIGDRGIGANGENLSFCFGVPEANYAFAAC